MSPFWLADKLQGLLDKAEGPEALPDERKEMEELKALLPEIQEKVEDATEGLKTASTAGDAVKAALVSRGRGRFHSSNTSKKGVTGVTVPYMRCIVRLFSLIERSHHQV